MGSSIGSEKASDRHIIGLYTYEPGHDREHGGVAVNITPLGTYLLLITGKYPTREMVGNKR